MELRYGVDLEGATEFQRRVLGVVAQIPYGETRSYSWVAERAGGSPRAVGQALARNPYPLLIPCHRVVKKDGGLGGYTGGADLKRKLLELEREAVGHHPLARITQNLASCLQGFPTVMCSISKR